MSVGAPNFSPSLTLAGMDYIAPSAACIKPTLINNRGVAGGGVGRDGVVGVRSGGNQIAALPAGATGSSNRGPHADVVKITLQDCLACSGCLTTAETVLVNAQSRTEIIATLLGASSSLFTATETTAAVSNTASLKVSSRARLVSISPQSCASLAAYLGMPMEETYALMSGFLRAVLTPEGLQAQAAASGGLARSAEGVQKQVDRGNEELSIPSTASAAPPTENEMGNSAETATHASPPSSPPIYVIDLEWAEQLSAVLTAQEYTRRRTDAPETLPMIVSTCPGWVCYCEKQGSVLLPHLSAVMSAQGIIGSYAKRTVATDLYHISVQPCFDRKLEAARDSMVSASPASSSSPVVEAPQTPVFYTDCVLSTAELLEWMKEVDTTLPWRAPLDNRAVHAVSSGAADATVNEEERAHNDGGQASTVPSAAAGSYTPNAILSAAARDAARLAGSGGYHQCVIADRIRRHQTTAADIVPATSTDIKYEVKRNRNHQLATCDALPGEVFCVGYGFQQIQNIVRGLKKKMPAMRSYTFVELMACPDGCLNGGGQIRPAQQLHSEVLDAVINAYAQHTDAKTNTTNIHVEMRKEEEEEKATRRRRVEHTADAVSHLDSVTRRPFADATVAVVAPSLGDNLWRCGFRDREKEFAEVLNAGNIHSLKW